MERYGSIYVITNCVNGKQYVGQTVSALKLRWAQHKSRAKHVEHDSLFMRAIRKYGPEAFHVEEVAVAFDRESLDAAEDVCIQQFNTLSPVGYNLCLGGGGHNHHEETKVKIRAHKHSDETRQQMSESQLRRYQDPDARAKQGRVQTESERLKRSETMKRIGHRPPQTPESIAKMAASKRGKPGAKARQIVDQNGVVYRSMSEAAEATGCHLSSISLQINGKRSEPIKGFTFTYLKAS